MKLVARFLTISIITILSLTVINCITFCCFFIEAIPTGMVTTQYFLTLGTVFTPILAIYAVLAYALLVLTIFSIRKRRVIMPMLAGAQFLLDLVLTLVLSWNINPVVEWMSMIISITMIVFLCIYCYKCIREKIQKRKQAKVPTADTEQLDEPNT